MRGRLQRQRQSKSRPSWYKSPQWRNLAKRQLRKQPMCQCPHCKGEDRRASIVDHIQPHRGDWRKFIDARNLQSMNKQCHDKFKQSQEKGGHGFDMGCNEAGEPLSKEHDWYRS